MDDSDRARRLAAAIRERMRERGITQDDLGREVAHLEGRDEPHGQATVAAWLRRRDLLGNPDRVFAIERALGVPPGSLSRIVGFLPLTASPCLTVPDAVRADVELTIDQQEDLVAVWSTMVERSRARRRLDP